MEDFVPQPVEHRPERRQREIAATDIGDLEAAGARRPDRCFDLGDFRWRQAVAPFRLAPAHLRASPDRWAFD